MTCLCEVFGTNVVSLASAAARRDLTRPSNDQLAENSVASQLGHDRIPPERLAEAKARAVNNVHRGHSVGEAVRRAVAWARSAIDPTLPPAA
jgi:hypothetical protein